MKTKQLKKLKALRDKICEEAKKLWHYEGDDHLYPDFLLSVSVTKIWRKNPVWPVIIGAAGSGKTDLLMCMYGHKLVSMLDTLSPKALTSGWHGEDASLIPLLDDRILVLKDMTTMLESDPRKRDEVIGKLRSVYDGQAGAGFGVGGADSGMKEHTCNITIIGACTNVFESYSNINTQLGERFNIWKFRHVNPLASAEKALDNMAQGKDRRHITKLMHKFLDLLDPKKLPKLSSVTRTEEQKQELLKMADLVARARTHVKRDRWKDVLDEPSVETPTRLVIQLTKIAAGSAVSHGRTYINHQDMRIARRVASDSIPTSRMRIIANLYDHRKQVMKSYPEDIVRQGMSSKDLCKHTQVSNTVMRRTLEDLSLCKVLQKIEVQGLPNKFVINNGYIQVLKKSKLYKSGKDDHHKKNEEKKPNSLKKRIKKLKKR